MTKINLISHHKLLLVLLSTMLISLPFAYSQTIFEENLPYTIDQCVIYDTITNRIIYRTVDPMPSFPGGLDSLYSFIKNNLLRPIGIDSDCHEMVFVSFIVEDDGRLTNIKFERLIHCFEYVDAIIQMIERMPNWNSGKCNGIPVPVIYILPIKVPPR